MRRHGLGTRTIDGVSGLRCMTVALTAEQDQACRSAIVPVEVVSRLSVKEACISMSTDLPLVVIVDDKLSEADRAQLFDMTTACGAEVVVLDGSPTPLQQRLLDALRIAERRRLGFRVL